ncbi:MAG TPA: dihydrofolate reductase, partial [Acidimicrobiia bacterium]|nr:dihydrofolate reductase [Acidimicrobiia bacterium]
MRSLVLWDLITLDGYFEGPEKWDLAFHEIAWGPELEAFSLEQAEEVGVLLFGRVTYEGMATHWAQARGPIADFMNGVTKVVVSTTLEEASWENTRLLSADVAKEVRRLKA